MPIIIELRNVGDVDNSFSSIYFLLKEETFLHEGLELLRQRIFNAVKFEDATDEDILGIAEDTIKEFKYTQLPFSLYVIKY